MLVNVLNIVIFLRDLEYELSEFFLFEHFENSKKQEVMGKMCFTYFTKIDIRCDPNKTLTSTHSCTCLKLKVLLNLKELL